MKVNRKKSSDLREMISDLKECGYSREDRKTWIEDYYKTSDRLHCSWFVLPLEGVLINLGWYRSIDNITFEYSAVTMGYTFFYCLYQGLCLRKKNKQLGYMKETARINREVKQTGKLPENLEDSLGLDGV